MIRKPMIPLASLVMMCSVGCATSARAQSYLMHTADVHRDQIVFAYEGDLWTVSSAGGDAVRITNDPGTESLPKFSPDGERIAFTAQYDGGEDVYVMDARGGAPRRLTYHPASDRVLDWFPDGGHVLFRSRREYPFRADMIYKVSASGGVPVKLNVDRAGLTAVSPDATMIAYNRGSRENRTWKRHQGGTAQDIWVGRLDQADYRRITDWPGSDNFPMWRGDKIYFNSDREFGTLNLYRCDIDGSNVEALTSYKDYDVKFPSLGVDQIVFEHAAQLHLLDLTSGKIRMVPINIPSDRFRLRREFVKVAPSKGSFGLSPTGKRMLLEARGDIFNLPVEDGEAINLTSTTDAREKNAAWSPDGRWIVFISDKTGEEELYLVDQRATEDWRQLTSGGLGYRMQPVWSPDGKHLVFADKSMRLNLVDVDTQKIQVLDQGDYDDGWERWGIQDYVWSPDSRWIAYTKMEQSLNESIFLYSLDEKKSYRVTDEMTEDWSPSFDPKGRFLYFLSNRTFDATMGFVDQNHIFLDLCRPYLAILESGEPSPFAPKDSQEEVSPEERAEAEPADDGKPDAAQVKAGHDEKKTKIEPTGIEARIVVAPGVSAGNYFRLEATETGFYYLAKTQREFLKYQAVSDETGGRLDLYHFDLKKDKTTKIMSGIANYHTSADGKKLVYRAGSKYGVVDVPSKADVGDGAVSLDDVLVEVDRHEEFLQIFDEAWRIQRDWFYDPDMQGVDWEATKQKYRRFVSSCGD